MEPAWSNLAAGAVDPEDAAEDAITGRGPGRRPLMTGEGDEGGTNARTYMMKCTA
jgi:hypothetical protein